ncbi:MAG: DUF3782 domain-containing protein [bacterium]
MQGRVLKFKEEEEHILKALPALLKKDVWFRREVSVILSEIFSTKGELKQMFEESRISHEKANQRIELMEHNFEASGRRFDALLQEMHDGFESQRQEINKLDTKVDSLDAKFDVQGQAIKELDAKFDVHGQAIKELDTKFDSLDTKVDRLDTKVDRLDTKVDSLDTKVNSLDTKVNSLDAKVDSLDTKVNSLDTKFNSLDTKVDSLDAKFDNLDAKVDDQWQAIKCLDVKTDKLTIKIDTLGSRWGIFAEATIRNTLRELLTKHLDVEEIVEWKVHDKDGIVFGYPQDIQIDFLIKNGEEYLGEIKSSAGSADVSILSRKAKFYTQITGKIPKILLVAVSVNEECRKSCEQLNVQLITHEEL